MAHIQLPESLPGILGPLMAYPSTAAPLNAFTQELLRGPSSLTEAERELLASAVSQQNDCYFCTNAHAAVARTLWPQDDRDAIDKVVFNADYTAVNPKMRTLLTIALATQQGGKFVTAEMVDRARAAGADDKAIHDTVLIAAAFCLFNRYVDGLSTLTPSDPAIYAGIGDMLAQQGYNLTM